MYTIRFCSYFVQITQSAGFHAHSTIQVIYLGFKLNWNYAAAARNYAALNIKNADNVGNEFPQTNEPLRNWIVNQPDHSIIKCYILVKFILLMIITCISICLYLHSLLHLPFYLQTISYLYDVIKFYWKKAPHALIHHEYDIKRRGLLLVFIQLSLE